MKTLIKNYCLWLGLGGQPTATSTQQNFWLVGLLRTLESEGIVERDVTTKKWRLK